MLYVKHAGHTGTAEEVGRGNLLLSELSDF